MEETKLLDLDGLSYYNDKIQEEIESKQDTLISGTNIKTINNQSLLGSGNIPSLITYGTTDISPGDPLDTGTLYIVYE